MGTAKCWPQRWSGVSVVGSAVGIRDLALVFVRASGWGCRHRQVSPPPNTRGAQGHSGRSGLHLGTQFCSTFCPILQHFHTSSHLLEPFEVHLCVHWAQMCTTRPHGPSADQGWGWGWQPHPHHHRPVHTVASPTPRGLWGTEKIRDGTTTLHTG